MGWIDLTGTGITYSESPIESQRFGIKIANLQIGAEVHDSRADLKQIIESSTADLVVIRYPSQLRWVGVEISQTTWKQITCDSTVYFASANSPVVEKPQHSNFRIEQCEPDELSKLVTVTRNSFKGYINHWHYNSKTSNSKIEEAYEEWLIGSAGKFGYQTYLMSDGSDPIGMALLLNHQHVSEILLAGMTSEYQGKGLYGQLLHFVEKDVREKRDTQIIISTQSQNINVQKAWVRRAWNPILTIQTIHLNRTEKS